MGIQSLLLAAAGLATAAATSLRAGASGPVYNATCLMIGAKAGFDDRANEHYTEGSERWSGIDGKVMPPHGEKRLDTAGSRLPFLALQLATHAPRSCLGPLSPAAPPYSDCSSFVTWICE